MPPRRRSEGGWLDAARPLARRRTVLLLAALLAAPAVVGLAQGSEVAFDLRIEGGRVVPGQRLVRIRQGDSVRLRWTSDRAMVLHLHGYDIEVKVGPGAVAEMAFHARAAGRFTVEEHKPDARGGHSHGEPLVRIEVRPR